MNEAELLLSEILNCDRLSLYTNKNMLLDRERSYLVSQVLRRRIKGEPIQYILGKTEFMGLEFKLTPDVFIPRPETEIIVEYIIKELYHYLYRNSRTIRILDIGTGSGIIAVSLAKFLASTDISATDISQAALKIAEENAQHNDVRINFVHGDLFNAPNLLTDSFDLVVSNPPYIAAADLDNLPIEIQNEPKIALDGGEDGLLFYRRIISDSVRYLKKGGCLVLEMGFEQSAAINDIFTNSKNFKIIRVIKDFNHMDRIIIGSKV